MDFHFHKGYFINGCVRSALELIKPNGGVVCFPGQIEGAKSSAIVIFDAGHVPRSLLSHGISLTLAKFLSALSTNRLEYQTAVSVLIFLVRLLPRIWPNVKRKPLICGEEISNRPRHQQRS